MTSLLPNSHAELVPDPHPLWAEGRRRKQRQRTAMLAAGTVTTMALVGAVALTIPLSARSPHPRATNASPSTLPAVTLAASSEPAGPAAAQSVAAQLQALVAQDLPTGSENLLDTGATHELPPDPIPKHAPGSRFSLLGASYYALPGEVGSVTLAAVQADPSMTLAQVGDLYGIAAKPGASQAIDATTASTSDANGWQVSGLELAPGGTYVYVHCFGPSKASLGSVDASTLLSEAVQALSAG
jgi:hypothetical protein